MSNFDVVVTTYEMAASPNMKTTICHRIHWRYLVLDEGHRIKNEKTNLYERLRLVKAQRKLLLTGTPLQNNLHELWALLHFLHPVPSLYLPCTFPVPSLYREPCTFPVPSLYREPCTFLVPW